VASIMDPPRSQSGASFDAGSKHSCYMHQASDQEEGMGAAASLDADALTAMIRTPLRLPALLESVRTCRVFLLSAYQV
jgi:hypothetical protein